MFNSICLWNRRMFKVVDKEFLTLDLKNTWILQNYYIRELKMYFSLFSFHRWFPLEHVFKYVSLMQWGEKSNFKHIISTRVHQKKIKNYFKEYVMWKRFKFWSMKNVSENDKPVRVWLKASHKSIFFAKEVKLTSFLNLFSLYIKTSNTKKLM